MHKFITSLLLLASLAFAAPGDTTARDTTAPVYKCVTATGKCYYSYEKIHSGAGSLPVATTTVLGGVKQGSGTTISGDGTISVAGAPSVYATTAAMDAVTGSAGSLAWTVDDGYSAMVPWYWDTAHYNGATPAVKTPRWTRVNKQVQLYEMRQAAGMGAVNTTVPTRIDAANTSAPAAGWFGLRARDLREKTIVYKMKANIVWKLADQTNIINIRILNPSDTSQTWGLVRMNTRQNYTTLGYVAGNDCMGELEWEMYKVASQNSTAAGNITCYTRFKFQAWAKLATTTTQIFLESGESEMPGLSFDPTVDQPLSIWVHHSVAAANNSFSINWVSLSEGGR